MAGLNVDNFRITELTAGATLGALVVQGTGWPGWAVGVTFAAVSIVAGVVTRTWLVPILVGLAMFAARPVWLSPAADSASEVPALSGLTSTTTTTTTRPEPGPVPGSELTVPPAAPPTTGDPDDGGGGEAAETG